MSMEANRSPHEQMPVHPASLGATEMHRLWRLRGQIEGDRRDNSLRLVLGLWLVLAAAVGIRTLVRPNSHTVFPIFAASAEHWWGDRALYHFYPPLDKFRYPPVFALFMTPFFALGLSAGGILWSWTGIAVYVAGLWRFAHDVIPSAWTRRRTAWFLALGALGALRGLWNAQSNALVVGLFLLGATALLRALKDDTQEKGGRRWWLAAFLLALPVCLKLTPLAPVLLLCALWPRRLAWRLALAITVYFLLPFLTRPPVIVLANYRSWIDHLLETGNERWLGFRDGWTIWQILRHVFVGESGPLPLREPMDSVWYRLVQLTSALAVLGWCLWQQRRAAQFGIGPRWLVHVSLSMGLAWLMLFGPAVEHATYVFLTPPLAWAVLDRQAWPKGRWLILAAFAFIMILGWGAVTRLLPTWPVLLTALPAGTALFSLWLIGYTGLNRTKLHPRPFPIENIAELTHESRREHSRSRTVFE